ncbi:hypothetical protein PIB30_094362 [Stylosanthes scabra]|uniref:Wound-responsive family protein n=1 Tax=Stylosanthes scabra TaxID=79078 RepID=A0ABU6XUH1_9FABA|nr:hypothetical protein [Stylosanthes scabra]
MSVSRIITSVNMNSRIKAWTVAASAGVVEALKDQGICRWNHVLKSAQQHVKIHVRYLSQPKKLPSSAMVSNSKKERTRFVPHHASTMVNSYNNKLKKPEESLRTVMYLSLWGPN